MEILKKKKKIVDKSERQEEIVQEGKKKPRVAKMYITENIPLW